MIFMKSIFAALLIYSIVLTGFTASFAQTRGAGNVKVTDSKGKTREVKLYEGSYALVIGESNYTNGWDTLDGVKTDVAEVKRVLEKDFTVEAEMDLTSDALKTRIEKFISDYGYAENNRLLIYFAGHGHTAKSLDGRDLGYIIPVDTPLPEKDALGFKRKAIPMDTIQDYARRIEAKHALFVFDSCFSGKLVSREAMVVPPVIREDVTFPVRQFITAGAANQPVPDDSIFRKVFVRSLEGEGDLNNDGYITGTELAAFLKDKVTNATDRAQTPQYGKIRDIDLERGDFIFVSAKSVLPLNAPATANIAGENGNANSTDDFYKKQMNKALEARKTSAEEVDLPVELRAVSILKQKAKIAEMIKNGYKIPMDFFDLAKKYSDKEWVELPLVTQSFILDVGESAGSLPFTAFSFTDEDYEIKNPDVESPEYNLFKTLADDYDGKKYDLENPADRFALRKRLLQMLNPKAKTVLEKIASSYQQKFNRPLIIKSLGHSMDYQTTINTVNPNSYRVRGKDSLPPHTSGMVFDIYYENLGSEERIFLTNQLLILEKQNIVDALIERSPTYVFHIFVF